MNTDPAASETELTGVAEIQPGTGLGAGAPVPQLPEVVAAEEIPLSVAGSFVLDTLLTREQLPQSENGVFTSSGRFLVATAANQIYEVEEGPDTFELTTLVDDSECVFGGIAAAGEDVYSVCTGLGQGDAAGSYLFHLEFGNDGELHVERTALQGTVGLTHYNGMAFAPDGTLYVSNSLSGFTGDPSISRIRILGTNPLRIEQTAYVLPAVLTALPNNGGLLFPNGIRIVDNSLLFVRGVDIVRMRLRTVGEIRGVRPIYVAPGLSTIDDFAVAQDHLWIAVINNFGFVSRELAPSWLVVTDLRGRVERQIELPFIPSSTAMRDSSIFGENAVILTSVFDGGLYRIIWD